ncbi:hypothetical protein [Achromobacter marplatensis]|uniref:Uncharacterized protein n=1 Tax=Achromobacter marplatensis TaxID=470868 RepID=A0AA42W9L2_9BURK|nr:hypothetical protein [Achromobacter marplatensis]MDH2051194.1 hypothetical protein [Achromobacter marplatensis]
MNDVIEAPARQAGIVPQQDGRSSVADVTRHVIAVQEVMRSVMKPNVHYGAIPGAGEKPTLLKPGAEVLCMTFRIADEYEIVDLSTAGAVRYRVKCIGRHQATGVALGSGLGEASTDEEKYRWRKAICDAEFEGTPADMKRTKYGRKSGGHYTVQQIRTEPADLANTVLKMACKRAKIAMVLNVTAASDMFSQDLDDLDAELVRHLAEDDREAHMQEVRSEWVTHAQAAATEDELRATMKAGVKVFQAARDQDGYKQFAAAVQKRGAEIKQPQGDSNA